MAKLSQDLGRAEASCSRRPQDAAFTPSPATNVTANDSPEKPWWSTIDTEPIKSYDAAAKAHRANFMKDKVPHKLSPLEVEEIRLHCRNRLELMRRMEAEYPPGTGSRTKPFLDQLFLCNVDYWTWFFRIFRMADLPAEIISNIFRLVAWSAPDPGTGINWRLWISWTCHQWRTIAVEDSTLWNAIWFRDAPTFTRSIAWFHRAGAAPLDLRINDIPSYNFTAESIAQLLKILLTKISHIRILIVVVESWDPVLVTLDRLRTVVKPNTPMCLERFELHRTGSPYVQIGAGYEPRAFRDPMALFGGVNVRSLRYFSMNGVHIDWNRSNLTNITTLDIRRLPLELSPTALRFREMLQQAPALRKLCLDGAGPQWQATDIQHLPPIRLPNLRILVIADFALGYGLYVMSQISAPNIRDLTLMNFVGEDYNPFFALITAAFPETRILTIYSLELAGTTREELTTMVNCLRTMPRLTYLRMANIQKTFLDCFMYDDRTRYPPTDPRFFTMPPWNPVCPRLAYIDCQVVDPDIVASWAQARRIIGAPIRKIYITKELAYKLTPESYRRIISVAPLVCLPPGARAPEEDGLLNS